MDKLYHHKIDCIDKDKDSMEADDGIILVLGFFGGSIGSLKKKYSHLGPIFKMEIFAIPCPWRYLYFEGLMWKWVKKNLDNYYSKGVAKKSTILVVSSGGGTVLYSHFLRWIRKKGENFPKIKSIMWEHAPGSISPDEYYRAAKRLINLEKSLLLPIVLYPLIVLSCMALDFFTDYAKRVRMTPWSPELVPETVNSEFCIANLYDPILEFSYVDRWIRKMKSLGRTINLQVFESDGHLNGHKAYPEAYIKTWEQFINQFHGTHTKEREVS